MNIRTLRADEIEARVQTVKQNGCSLLLFKDARCDMKILDETFGIMGWQREHTVINGNLFCTISVWDKEKQMWISKQDVGTESYTEKEKGQASDSFKRACFNLGIGRELYTAPFIWINLSQNEVYKKNDKYSVQANIKFSVKEISYNENKEIDRLVIVDNKGSVRYETGKVIKSNNDKSSSTPTSDKPTTSNNTNTDYKCLDCKATITQAVDTYSNNNFGRALCRECQNKQKKVS